MTWSWPVVHWCSLLPKHPAHMRTRAQGMQKCCTLMLTCTDGCTLGRGGGSAPNSGSRALMLCPASASCINVPGTGAGHEATSPNALASAQGPSEKYRGPSMCDRGVRTLLKGCSDSTTTEFCSPPRRSFSSWRCRQKVNLWAGGASSIWHIQLISK